MHTGRRPAALGPPVGAGEPLDDPDGSEEVARARRGGLAGGPDADEARAARLTPLAHRAQGRPPGLALGLPRPPPRRFAAVGLHQRGSLPARRGRPGAGGAARGVCDPLLRPGQLERRGTPKVRRPRRAPLLRPHARRPARRRPPRSTIPPMSRNSAEETARVRSPRARQDKRAGAWMDPAGRKEAPRRHGPQPPGAPPGLEPPGPSPAPDGSPRFRPDAGPEGDDGPGRAEGGVTVDSRPKSGPIRSQKCIH